MSAQLKIECVDKLGVLISKPKRIKMLVGGRASTKSTFVADYVLSQVQRGMTWCCSREYQNSIEDSVHSLLLDEIDRCGFSGFEPLKTEIPHASGGRAFYRGLARNITSLKGINANGLWIEEGESLSEQTIKILTASIRISAKEVQQARETGQEAVIPEIWITLNRGSTADPISKKFLARAEKELMRCGYYEDDMIMIVQVNYDENPWFEESGLVQERLDDLKHMTTAEYDHKWNGAYSDSIPNSIIPVDWFNAAIDAHEKLGFDPVGQKVVSHDPSDLGPDSKGLAMRHGSVVLDVQEKIDGDVNDGCDWATDYAIDNNADLFVWDCDGLGVTLRRQVSQAFTGKHIEFEMFKGSEAAENPDDIYQPDNGLVQKDARTNKQTFRNKRAQYYWRLRDRFYNTYRAIVKKEYIDPDTMISLSSDISCMDQLRSEVCRIPKKPNGNGLIQIMSKDEMLNKHKIASPNLADSLAMSMIIPEISESVTLSFASEF